jgi:hypothetical protein
MRESLQPPRAILERRRKHEFPFVRPTGRRYTHGADSDDIARAAVRLTPLDGARLISSVAATLFGDDEFILREVSPETLLAASPSRRQKASGR